MITLKLKAGLGNQLFQYAYARALSLRSNTPLTIDTSWYSHIPNKDTKRFFLLNKYNISQDVICRESTESLYSVYIRKIIHKIQRVRGYSDYVYYPNESLPIRGNKTVEGYWNCETYFKDIEKLLKQELTLKEELSKSAQEAKEKIQKLSDVTDVVLIHVRRGDYITNQHAHAHHGFTGVQYYTEAIHTLLSKIKSVATKNIPHFILASDDVVWTKEHIIPLLGNMQYTVLSEEFRMPDYEELYIMSCCTHFIIANSTFSWWAAWLSDTAKKMGKEKIVIGPKQWTANPSVDTRDVLPKDWIHI